MLSTPKGLRLQIALVGRTNVGKSSFLNFVTNQDIAIVSPIPGTTTDVVEKPIELLPFGPVNFLDTGGVDDSSILANKRIQRTQKIFERADVVTLVVEPNIWTDFEKNLAESAKKQNLPLIVVINKVDLEEPKENFIDKIKEYTENVLSVSCLNKSSYDRTLEEFKKLLFKVSENIKDREISLLGDLLPNNALVVFIVPIDSEAPKGRLILPQVQAIRDVLDNNCAVLVVKDSEYKQYLTSLARKPDLVVCDSQVVHKMVAETPEDVKCTTFSILFCRYKGDLMTEVLGSAYADFLEDGDNVLIAEACSHHPLQDDIGRVKIPRWLHEYLGRKLNFDVFAGRDFPEDLKKYKLIIHCGSCMLTRREKLIRIEKARAQGIPITNYGILISKCQGVLERVLSPFPDILKAYKEVLASNEKVLTL
ncbi:MAG: [FeFe] hydrogenase H-cluster maturation GTPase HydF [Candidatus Kapaibacteriota bacterium]|jgi:[FeFe] hydrogenase H-cluster maturation GTPase HydF